MQYHAITQATEPRTMIQQYQDYKRTSEILLECIGHGLEGQARQDYIEEAAALEREANKLLDKLTAFDVRT